MNHLNDLELALRKLPGVRSTGFTERDDVMFVQVHAEPCSGDSGLALRVSQLASRHTERPVAVELVRWRGAPPGGAGNGKGPAAAHSTVDLTADEPRRPTGARRSATDEVVVAEGVANGVEADGAESNAADVESIGREARVKLLAVLSFPDTDEIEVHVTLGDQRTIGRALGGRGVVAAVEATVDALRGLSEGLVFTPVWAEEVESDEDAGHVVAVGLSDGRAPRHGIAAGDTDMEAAARATLDALNRTLALELVPGTIASPDI